MTDMKEVLLFLHKCVRVFRCPFSGFVWKTSFFSHFLHLLFILYFFVFSFHQMNFSQCWYCAQTMPCRHASKPRRDEGSEQISNIASLHIALAFSAYKLHTKKSYILVFSFFFLSRQFFFTALYFVLKFNKASACDSTI